MDYSSKHVLRDEEGIFQPQGPLDMESVERKFAIIIESTDGIKNWDTLSPSTESFKGDDIT